jgi:type I restriction enzyme S subunit
LNVTKENMLESGVPCLTYGDVHSRLGFEFDPCRDKLKCVSTDYLVQNPSSLLSVGDFVFADTSEDIAGSGNFSHLINEAKVFAGYHTVVARLIENNVPRFLAYFFESSAFREQVRQSVKGVKVYSITKGVLKDLWVWLPKFREQQLIASYLDKKVEALDRAVGAKEQQIILLKERKQILIQNAVTRGLNPDSPMRDSGVEWIGEIPAHWIMRRSKFVFCQRKELARKDDVQLSATQSYGVIPQEEYEAKVGRKVVRITFNLEKRKHVEVDDFVISMRSFQGGLERAWASGCIRSSYVVLRPALEISPDYYGYLFKSQSYIQALQTTANFIRDGQDLNFDNFSMVDLPIPPADEQKRIARHLKAQIERSDGAVALLEQQITKLKEYKATMINSAVTGKFKVPGVVEPVQGMNEPEAREVCQ